MTDDFILSSWKFCRMWRCRPLWLRVWLTPHRTSIWAFIYSYRRNNYFRQFRCVLFFIGLWVKFLFLLLLVLLLKSLSRLCSSLRWQYLLLRRIVLLKILGYRCRIMKRRFAWELLIAIINNFSNWRFFLLLFRI